MPDGVTPALTDEARQLLSSLTDQRGHVLGILEGLPDEALRRAVLPSGWTCLGLVRHLSWDVERFWFQGVMAGVPDAQGGWARAWDVGPDVLAQDVLDEYRDEIARADTVIGATPLGTAPAWWPPDWSPWARDLRRVLLHVITETATHAGHLDAVRELIDGRRWLILD
jgi:hypothetical protein